MNEQLGNDLDAIIRNNLARIEAAGIQQSDQLRVAHSDFGKVRTNLARGWGPDIQFLKQGLKYLKKAATAADSAELSEFAAELTVWKRSWDARPLVNEEPTTARLDECVRAIARRQQERGCWLVKDDSVASTKNKGGAWETLDWHRDGALIEGNSTYIRFTFADPELPKRLFKNLVKRLTKSMGKPTGRAKQKRFEADGLALDVEMTRSGSGGVFAFDQHILTVSNQGGSADLEF